MTDRLRVHIDGQCLQTVSRVRGIGRYVTQLLIAMAERGDVDVLVALNAAFPEELVAVRDLFARTAPNIECTVWESARCLPENSSGHEERRAASELALVHHMNRHGAGVVVSAAAFEGLLDHSVPLLPSGALHAPAAALWYDAIPYRFANDYLPEEPLRRAYLRRLDATGHFDHLLCISAFAEREAIELLGAEGRTTNIDGAAADLFRAGSEVDDVPDSGDGYLLYVGGFDARKNVEVIAQALAILDRRSTKPASLRVVGPSDGPQLEQFLSTWRGQGLDPAMLDVYGTVSDDDLVPLYRDAAVVIQPSLMEGFGLTALEAMTIGTPVVAARAGALPDVVGDDRLLFDPRSPDELADLLERMRTDDVFRRESVARGRTHAASYSWEAVAERAVDALRGIADDAAADLSADRTAVAAEAARRLLAPALVAETLARAEPTVRGPKKLFVDVSSTVTSDRHTGIQRVVRRTCDALVADGAVDASVRIIGCTNESGWFELDSLDGGLPSEGPRPQPTAGDVILMLDSSWEFYARHRPFLMAARAQGCEVISCLYDTVPLTMPAFCADGMPDMFRRWFVHALEVSTGFVCISQAVADDLLGLLDAIGYPRPMHVGHWQLGCDFTDDATAEASSRTEGGPPVALMVGTVEPRKGHAVALDAVERLWERGVDIELVIAGGEGWAVDHTVKRIRTHPEYGRRLRWHEKVDDDRLAALYRDSDILLAASWGEGFGLPIVEAARFGMRLVASDIPVFREVGKATLGPVFFETGNAVALGDALATALEAPAPSQRGVPEWPDWTAGTRQLVDVLLDEHWYQTYEPSQQTAGGFSLEFSRVEDDSGDHRRGELQLIETPRQRPDRGGVHLKIAATNRSAAAWLGELHEGHARSVQVLYGVPTQEGVHDGRLASRALPFALPVEETTYLEIVIPDAWLGSDETTVAVALSDGTGVAFGSPLLIET